MKKKIWLIILGAGWVILIGFLFYIYAWKAMERRAYFSGSNDTVAAIIMQVRQNGETRINTPNQVLVLVEKTEKNGRGN